MDAGNKMKMGKEKGMKKETVLGACDEESDCFEEEKRKRLMGFGGGSVSAKKGGYGSGMRCCQAEKCTADLSDAKQYHRRHKVCEYHAKAQVVLVGGTRQRFCQQCSRFHELAEFDDTKRSCRRRLAGHNERRRKNSGESHAEGSSCKAAGTTHQLKELVCGQADGRDRRIQVTIQENAAACKHFQII